MHAVTQLADLLAKRGDLDGLRARADAGDGAAASRLAELLAERGDLDGLRDRADAGDGAPPRGWPSCWPSAATSTSCGPWPTPATGTAAARLPDLLTEQGRGEEAERLRRFGLNPDGSIACA